MMHNGHFLSVILLYTLYYWIIFLMHYDGGSIQIISLCKNINTAI